MKERSCVLEDAEVELEETEADETQVRTTCFLFGKSYEKHGKIFYL